MSLIKTTTPLIIFCLFITTLAYAKTAEDYFNSGLDKYDKQDYKGAIEDYNKAIELNPNYALAYSIRGAAKGELKDYRGAMQDYNKAIEFNPNDASAYYNRGNAKSYLIDYRGAIQDYNKAIEFNPNHADAYHNRGLAKSYLKDNRGTSLDLFRTKILELKNSTFIYNLTNTAQIFNIQPCYY